MAASYFNEDIIVAIASATHAQAPIGIIRISGAGSLSFIAKAIRRFSKKDEFVLERIQSHKLQRCLIVDISGKILDDAMFVWMKSPNSFTGEESVELHMHGNPFTMRRVLALLTSLGARLALPGEFSFRAFRNGKMDLSQAEAVMDLISSKSQYGTESALHSLLGSTRSIVDQLKAELLHCLAEIEVDIDFSDQGLSQIDFDVWSTKLEKWCSKVESVRHTFQRAAPLREGIRVAIVGAPNSGKSTLFNRLLGEERSIVSDIAGTTRDVVRESFQLAGLLFLLSDTAGIRETTDKIETEGIARSLGELLSAQFVFWIVDGKIAQNTGSIEDFRKTLKSLKASNPHAKFLLFWNKCDILEPQQELLFDIRKNLNIPVIPISALSGKGLHDLEQAVLQETQNLNEIDSESFQIGRLRHYELLGKAVVFIQQAIHAARAVDALPDLLSSDLRAAMACLGEITGEVGIDDVLNHIFSEFCIGK